jgi:hypothetical protein
LIKLIPSITLSYPPLYIVLVGFIVIFIYIYIYIYICNGLWSYPLPVTLSFPLSLFIISLQIVPLLHSCYMIIFWIEIPHLSENMHYLSLEIWIANYLALFNAFLKLLLDFAFVDHSLPAKLLCLQLWIIICFFTHTLLYQDGSMLCMASQLKSNRGRLHAHVGRQAGNNFPKAWWGLFPKGILNHHVFPHSLLWSPDRCLWLWFSANLGFVLFCFVNWRLCIFLHKADFSSFSSSFAWWTSPF